MPIVDLTLMCVETRQKPLHVTQLVTMPGPALAAGIGPDLKEIVMLDIRDVLFPCRRVSQILSWIMGGCSGRIPSWRSQRFARPGA